MRAGSFGLLLFAVLAGPAQAQTLRGFESSLGTETRSGAMGQEADAIQFGGGSAFGADMTRRSLGGGAGAFGGGAIGQPPQSGVSGSGDLTVSSQQ